jgi:hypothetical protein
MAVGCLAQSRKTVSFLNAETSGMSVHAAFAAAGEAIDWFDEG